MIINDGTGTGNQARVDSVNRLRTRAVSISEAAHHTIVGRAYNINTGEMTLTSANESAVLYFKNNENSTFVVSAIAIGLGPSTGGASTDIPLVKVTRNPDAGTIISSPTNVDIVSNRNFGDTTSLTADVYKGGEGVTMTGDSDHILFYQGSNGRLFASIDAAIPKGSSLGIKITPQLSNTSMTCYAALIGYIEEDT